MSFGAAPFAAAPFAATVGGAATVNAVVGATLPMFTAAALVAAPVGAVVVAHLPALIAVGTVATGTRPDSIWSGFARPVSVLSPCADDRQGSIATLGGVGGAHRGAAADETPTVREFFADFDSPGHTLVGTSLARRPDAISLDYLTAVTLGPVDIGNVDEGTSVRVWKLRDDFGTIRLCRANAANDGYDAETVLFTYAQGGAPILELDFAFEQAGRPVVVAERASGVWLYWFNPTLSDFEFVNLGTGRTPRCLLDDPDPTSTTSDIMLFYIRNDAAGGTGAVCYRMQRERYAVEHLTPILGGGALQITPDGGNSFAMHGAGTVAGIDIVADGMMPPFPRGDSVTIDGVTTSFGPPPLGDFQLSSNGVSSYAGWFEFSEPIVEFRVTQFYPYSPQFAAPMFVTAVSDEFLTGDVAMGSSLPGGGVAVALSVADFGLFGPGVEAVVSSARGFRFVRIHSPTAGVPEYARYNEAPTFGGAMFTPMRDLSIPGTTFALPPIEQMYLEDAVKSREGRIVALFSVRNSVTGTYALQSLASSLYPVRANDSLLLPSPGVVAFALRKVLLTAGASGLDGFIDTDSLLAPLPLVTVGALTDALHSVDTDPDTLTTLVPLLIGGVLHTAVLLYEAVPDTLATDNPRVQGGALTAVVIVYVAAVDTLATTNPSLQSGSLT